MAFGDGAHDTATITGFHNTVTLGNGDHDLVNLTDGSQSTIKLGNGVGDGVSAGIHNTTITLGDGAGDQVFAQSSNLMAEEINNINNTITLGNGANDLVQVAGDALTTINLGDGDGDSVNVNCNFIASELIQSVTISTITVGNGNNDNVTVTSLENFGNGTPPIAATINVGNGNNDVVDASFTVASTINVGNGNDKIYVGTSSAVTVGTGQDTFVFDKNNFSTTQGTPGDAIGQVTIKGFDPSKDVIGLKAGFYNNYQVNDDSHGNAVISFPTLPPGTSTDTITLVGVHASNVHASDFQLVP